MVVNILQDLLTRPKALYGAIVATSSLIVAVASFGWKVWKHRDEKKKSSPTAELILKKTKPDDLVLYISVVNRKDTAIKVNRVWVEPGVGVDIALCRAHQQDDVLNDIEMVWKEPPWVIERVLSNGARLELTAYARSGFEKLKAVRIEWADIGPSQRTDVIKVPVRRSLVATQYVSEDDFLMQFPAHCSQRTNENSDAGARSV